MTRFWQFIFDSLSSLGKLGLGVVGVFMLLLTLAALRACGLNMGI